MVKWRRRCWKEKKRLHSVRSPPERPGLAEVGRRRLEDAVVDVDILYAPDCRDGFSEYRRVWIAEVDDHGGLPLRAASTGGSLLRCSLAFSPWHVAWAGLAVLFVFSPWLVAWAGYFVLFALWTVDNLGCSPFSSLLGLSVSVFVLGCPGVR